MNWELIELGDVSLHLRCIPGHTNSALPGLALEDVSIARQDLHEVLEFAAEGKIQPTIELQPLEAINQVFDKFRKSKTPSIVPIVLYHAIAVGLIVMLWLLGWLNLLTAAAFGIALCKLGMVLLCPEWYRTTVISSIALLETGGAVLFLAIVALSLLPTHL